MTDPGSDQGQGAGPTTAPETVPGANVLTVFADAFYQDADTLASARTQLSTELGPAALVDAAATVAIFDAVVRIADATGIPLEDTKAEISEDFRDTLGISDFPSAGGG